MEESLDTIIEGETPVKKELQEETSKKREIGILESAVAGVFCGFGMRVLMGDETLLTMWVDNPSFVGSVLFDSYVQTMPFAMGIGCVDLYQNNLNVISATKASWKGGLAFYAGSVVGQGIYHLGRYLL